MKRFHCCHPLFLFSIILLTSIGSVTAQNGAPQTLAFSSNRDGDFEIFLIDSSGNNLIKLTDNSESDSQPSWSQDGQLIAFTSERDGNPEIYVMNADGSDQRRLTYSEARDSQPSWSADGRQIAFASDVDGNSEIYVMNADGGSRRRLTSNPATDSKPIWSPDGQSIAFASNRTGSYEVFVMDTQGENLLQLTQNNVDDFPSGWVDGGDKLLYESNAGGDFDVYEMRADGTQAVPLITGALDQTGAVASPVTGQIATATMLSADDWDIALYKGDGSFVSELTDFRAIEKEPQWRPSVESAYVEGTQEATPDFGVRAAFTPDPTFGFVAVHDDGEQLYAITGPILDESSMPTIAGAVWVSPQGDAVVADFNASGLPERMVLDDVVVEFSHYTASTVDLRVIQSDGQAVTVPGVPLDQNRYEQLLNLGQNVGYEPMRIAYRAVRDWRTLGQVFKATGLGLGIGGCAISIAATVTTAGMAIPLAVASCASPLLDIASLITEDRYPRLSATFESVSAFIDGVSCRFDPEPFSRGLSCASLALSAASRVTDELARREEEQASAQQTATAFAAATSTFTPAPQPCTVSTSTANSVSVHVGPGNNRSSITWLPANRQIRVLGYASASDGSLWWKVDKSQVAPQSSANETWVAQSEVRTSGSCDLSAVGSVAPPPIVRIQPTAAPASPTPGPQSGGGYTIWFRADRYQLSAGECTYVRWDVENIDSVYYNGHPAVGHSESRECPSATTTYDLAVVLRNGSTVHQQVILQVGGSGVGPILGTGDVQITLQWNTNADLDLHVVDPYGEEINFSHRAAASGGQLDVDSNYPCGQNLYYVENVFWPSGRAPSGTYRVYVDEFDLCGASRPTWTLTARVDGQVVLQRSGSGDSSQFSFSR